MGNATFFTIMMDSPTVHQALASSEWHQAWLNGEHIKSTEHLPHQIAAIQCVNDKLAHPIIGISDETIGLVVAFSCQAIVDGDFDAWKTHMNGLEQMIAKRGGLAGITDRILRLMLHWVDVSGASNLDTRPRLPVPSELLPELTDFNYQYWPRVMRDSTYSSTARWSFGTIEIFNLISTLNKTITTELSKRDLWTDPVWAAINLTPVLHRLFSLPKILDKAEWLQESCRLTAILYVREIQRKFGLNTIPTDTYLSKIKTLMTKEMQWDLYNVDAGILLWIMITGGIAASYTAERSWFATSIANIMRQRGVRSWEDSVSSIPHSLWLQDVLECSSASLGADVVLAFFV